MSRERGGLGRKIVLVVQASFDGGQSKSCDKTTGVSAAINNKKQRFLVLFCPKAKPKYIH